MSHDANGNLTTWASNVGAQSYTFDVENRLRSATAGNATATYDYDSIGRRVAKTVNGTTTRYLLHGDEEIADLNGAGNVLRRYVPAMLVDDRVAIISGPSTAPTASARRFYRTNHQGSTIAMSESSGSEVARYAFDAYGNLQPGSTVADNPFLFAGRRIDPETGLYYYRARYYSPELGRFIQQDPIGYKEDLNLYVYAHNSPYNFTDPDGRRSVVVDGQINIQPEDRTVPSVSVQNNVGAKGVSPGDFSFHEYNVETTSNLSAEQAGEGFKTNPTPGNDKAASPSGTVNDVGPIPSTDGTNLVRSYSVESPDPSKFSDITVNYTIDGEHGLNEGFVIRFGVINADRTTTLRSYGEGNSLRQNPNLRDLRGYGWGPRVENVWQQNHREIINGAR